MNENIITITDPENPEEFRITTVVKPSEQNNNGVSNGMLGWMFAAPGDSAPGKSDDQKAKERDEELKRETFMSSTLRSIRNKFVDRQLAGRIVLSSTVSSLVTTAYYLTVSEGETHSYVDGNNPNSEKPEDIQKLTAEENRALTMSDTILNSLERRSLAWEGINFADNLLLARGASFGMTVPVFTFLTFNISIDLCATVKTLLASQKRYERRLLLEAKRDQFVSKYTPYSHSTAPLGGGVNSGASGTDKEVEMTTETKHRGGSEEDIQSQREESPSTLPGIDLFKWGKAIVNFVAPPPPPHTTSHHHEPPPVRIAPTVIEKKKVVEEPSKPIVPISFPHEPPGTVLLPVEEETRPVDKNDPLGATHRLAEKNLVPSNLHDSNNKKKPSTTTTTAEKKPTFKNLDDIDLYG